MTDTILKRLPWNEVWPKLKDLRLNSELQVFIVARISVLNISQMEDPEQISNILFYALTRGNQLIQQALAWQKPAIGSSSAPNDVQVNIAHGSLSLTKAIQWNLVNSYRLANNITLILFERLLFKLLDSWQLNEENHLLLPFIH